MRFIVRFEWGSEESIEFFSIFSVEEKEDSEEEGERNSSSVWFKWEFNGFPVGKVEREREKVDFSLFSSISLSLSFISICFFSISSVERDIYSPSLSIRQEESSSSMFSPLIPLKTKVDIDGRYNKMKKNVKSSGIIEKRERERKVRRYPRCPIRRGERIEPKPREKWRACIHGWFLLPQISGRRQLPIVSIPPKLIPKIERDKVLKN